MRRSSRRRILWLVVAAVCFAASDRVLRDTVGPAPAGGYAARALAPFAAPIAAFHRLASDAAITAGRPERSIEHLERGLAIAGDTTVLWEDLVERQGLWLASAIREPDGERRARWLREALRTAEAGIARARRPGRVAFSAGACLVVQARSEPPAPWPGGVSALYRDAATWFRRAEDLGDHRGIGAAAWCEARADEAAARGD